MAQALERHRRGRACVVPIIIRDCVWREAPFAGLKALPSDGRAVRLWPDRDSAWKDVARDCKAAPGGIQEKRRRPSRLICRRTLRRSRISAQCRLRGAELNFGRRSQWLVEYTAQSPETEAD
jgi:hypothetical protein